MVRAATIRVCRGADFLGGTARRCVSHSPSDQRGGRLTPRFMRQLHSAAKTRAAGAKWSIRIGELSHAFVSLPHRRMVNEITKDQRQWRSGLQR